MTKSHIIKIIATKGKNWIKILAVVAPPAAPCAKAGEMSMQLSLVNFYGGTPQSGRDYSLHPPQCNSDAGGATDWLDFGQ